MSFPIAFCVLPLKEGLYIMLSNDVSDYTKKLFSCIIKCEVEKSYNNDFCL